MSFEGTSGPPSKRKKDGGTECSGQETCIVHVKGLKYGDIRLLSAVKDPEQRLLRLHDIRRMRLSLPIDSAQRMQETCNLIPERLLPHHGYHQVCYQRFTANLDRLKVNPEQASASRSTRSLSTDRTVFKPDCIFCNRESRKKVKVRGTWTTEGLSVFDRDGGKTILDVAERKHDEKLLTRIRGFDLFACEAKYHQSCRTCYIQDATKWRSSDDKAKQEQVALEQAHAGAFDCVRKVIEEDVLRKKNIIKLKDLCSIYIESLDRTSHPNPFYRSENLKVKLEKHYRDSISCCPLGPFKSYIIYSKDIDVAAAMKYSYELGTKDVMKETGNHLHQEILSTFETSDELKWPPTAQDLEKMDDVLPASLEKFLSFVLFGKPSPTSEKTRRLLLSIGQDICRAATRGKWKLPKHIVMCVTLRHMFRSEHLITMLNRFGHSENYSYGLELETALAQAADLSSRLLSNQIVRNAGSNVVFHSEFDNFDQLINDVSGGGSIHTAHGIMLQEVKETDGLSNIVTPALERSGQRSLHLEDVSLPDCYVAVRKDPKMHIVRLSYEEGSAALSLSGRRQMVWLMSRVLFQNLQVVPGISGFISQTGRKPENLTTIEYYPVIPKPITDYSTVQECLRCSEAATLEVGQQYVITTFDLGVCMKAFPLVWNFPEKYANHIILLGTFHLICAYFKMVGKKMAGSGLPDILLEAGLITSGSVDGVMKGKHYDRAMHCHKVLLEALEQLLFQKFISCRGDVELNKILTDQTQKALKDMFSSPSTNAFQNIVNDEELLKLVAEYENFREDALGGSIGQTAQLWVSYMNHIWLVLSLLEAVKDNNFYLYAHCLHKMPGLFFSYGGQNYARYLSYFSVFLANIDESHPGALELVKAGAFSVARSFIPGNRADVDKTMEETFMRHAKSHGGSAGSGITGLLTNLNAYQRWVRSTHARSQFAKVALQMMGERSSGTDNTHRDLRPTEVLRGTKHVKKAKEALLSFMNPFEVDTNDLVVLSSGATVPRDVTHDVLRAECAGEEAKDEFITNRLKTGKDFFQPVKRLKLKTLESTTKRVKITASSNKVVQYKQQVNVVFQLFVKCQQQKNLQLDLAELLTYPLTPVPYSLATGDGFFAKTDKSKAFHHVSKNVSDATLPPVDETVTIYDGNAVFYYLKDVPSNFKLICEKIFSLLSKGDIIFSTDSYKPDSIKSMERQRRGTSEKLIIKGESTKRPKDWKTFLANDANKKQLTELLVAEWSKDTYAAKLEGRQVTAICDGKATHLTSQDGETTKSSNIESLQSSQEESDTRMVLYCKYAGSKGYRYCKVRSPDTDTFFILLHHASSLTGITILFDTGTGNNRRLLNMTELAKANTPAYCTSLMVIHAFSGCDTTSAFKGIGKVKPIKVLQGNPKYADTLSTLGDTWTVSDELLQELDTFTCAMYGKPRLNNVDSVRYVKINDKCSDNGIVPTKNVDIGCLPPCRRSLVQHIRRTSYQVAIWKRALDPNPSVPDPEGHGWTRVDGKLEPLWYEGNILPQALVDASVDHSERAVESDDDSEEDITTYDTDVQGSSYDVESESDED